MRSPGILTRTSRSSDQNSCRLRRRGPRSRDSQLRRAERIRLRSASLPSRSSLESPTNLLAEPNTLEAMAGKSGFSNQLRSSSGEPGSSSSLRTESGNSSLHPSHSSVSSRCVSHNLRQISLHECLFQSSVVQPPPRGESRGESRPESPPIFSDFTILHVNIQGFHSSQGKLEARLSLFSSLPGLILLNETRFDRASVPTLHGYTCACRKDRNSFGGGVAVFVKDEFSSLISPLPSSQLAECCWFVFHFD